MNLLATLRKSLFNKWLILGIVILIILAIVYFFLPKTELVKINFVVDGLPIEQDFNFVVNVDGGKAYIGNAVQGIAQLKLPKGKTIEFTDLGMNKFRIIRTQVAYSNNINVQMQQIYSVKRISLKFYLNELPYFGTVNLALSCDNASLSEKASSFEASGSYFEADVPENCGRLNISYAADSITPNTVECNATTCKIDLVPITKIDINGNVKYATGKLHVFVKRNNEFVSGAVVNVYNHKDLQTPVDLRTTNQVGLSEFSSLVVGKYKIFVSQRGFLTESADIEIKDNLTNESNIELNRVCLGEATLRFFSNVSSTSSIGLNGTIIVRNANMDLVHKDSVSNGLVIIPIESVSNKYYLDFIPNDVNLMPITAKEIVFELEKTYDYTLGERKFFDKGKIKIKVLDQDNAPVAGVKLLVKDKVSNFELLSYVLPLTDINGITFVSLPVGIYEFRAFNELAEGVSETVSVLPTDSSELPNYDTNVVLYYGYTLFNLDAVNEFSEPVKNANILFYKKPKTMFLERILDVDGKLSDNFRAGSNIYYKINANGYLPFISESRLLLPNQSWIANVNLSQKLDKQNEIAFLGMYESLDTMQTVKTLEIGRSYYVGYDLYIYKKPERNFVVEFYLGSEINLDSSKAFIINSYSSAEKEYRYLDLQKTEVSESNSKLINLKWNNPVEGVYRLFYKIQIKNSSEVKLSDLLEFNSLLFVDDILTSTKNNSLFIGGKSICGQNDFCSMMTVLDVKEKLYLDNISSGKYLMSPNKDYLLAFDLINGLEGFDAKIESGKLFVYNGATSVESFELVKNNRSSRSFIQLNDINISGPNSTNLYSSSTDVYGVFLEDYNFSNLFQNKSIRGLMTLRPIALEHSYINYSILDVARQQIVRNKTALSIDIVPSSTKDMSIEIFPNNLLIPDFTQFIDVYAKDSVSGSVISDAKVTVKYRTNTSYYYLVYPGCDNLSTDIYGKASCRIASADASLGTYFQVQVEKEGYNAYYHKDFTPDLKISDKFIEFNPNKIELNLVYPALEQDAVALDVINNSAVNLVIDHVELSVDKYSLEANVFDLNTMQNAFANIVGKTILGRTKMEDSVKTRIDNFLVAKVNELVASELQTSANVSGTVKIYFKTQSEALISYDVLFNLKLVNDNYPTNASDCLKVILNDKYFASDNGQLIRIPATIENSCSIQTQKTNYPVTFDNIYVLVNIVEGSFTLGQVSSFTISEFGFNASSLAYGVPEVIATNLKTNISNTVYDASIGFMPQGKLGSAKYSVKLFGVVNSKGQKIRIESKPEVFDISVLELADCIKIFDSEGKETSYLEASKRNPRQIEENFVSFEIRNICPELPIYIRLCKDNQGNINNSCSSSLELNGLSFNNDSLIGSQGLEIIGNQSISIKRPLIPGAYGIDLWARTEGQIDAKKINEIHLNVKTTTSSGLFAENPFLEVEQGKSDVMQVYNTWIGVDSGVSIMTNYLKFMKTECVNKGDICFKTYDELEDVGVNNGEAIFAAGAAAGIAAGIAFIVMGAIAYAAYAAVVASWAGAIAASAAAASAAAAAASAAAGTAGAASAAAAATSAAATASATAAAATSAGIAAGLAAVPVAGWIAAGVAMAVAISLIIWATFAGDMEQDDTDYLLYFEPSDEIISGQYNNAIIPITERDRILRYSAEDRFLFNSHYKAVWGETDLQPNTYHDALQFSVYCPTDYEVYTEGIDIAKKSDELDNVEITYDDCGFDSPDYEVRNDHVKFKPWCGGPAFTNFYLETYALVPCKLKSNLWGRVQHGGIAKETYDTGTLKFQFDNVNFSDCNTEWCYKTYTIRINDSLLGYKEDYYRIAYHNTDFEFTKSANIGEPCKNIYGKTIGFTGEDAVPKVEYKWNMSGQDSIDTDFCVPNANGDAKTYCDATQFFGSNLEKISAGSELLKQNYESKLDCPKSSGKNEFDLKFDIKNGKELFGISKPKSNYDKDLNKIMLGIPFAPIDLNGTTPNLILAKVVASGYEQMLDCNYIVMASNNTIVRYKPFCIWEIDFDMPDAEGIYDVFDKNITLQLSVNGMQTKTANIDFALKYTLQESKCILAKPSTAVVNGKMLIAYFLDVAETNDEKINDFFAVQDYFHYNVYLMQDGFSDEFVTDFFKSCADQFLSCPPGFDRFAAMAEDGRIKIMNRYMNSTRTNGPGLYSVHNVVTYPGFSNGLNIYDKNTKIDIYLEKVSGPENTSLFYYIPLDGRVGITNDVVNRVGYGSNFTGDIVTLYSNTVDVLNSGLRNSETSNSIANVNIDTSFNFDIANRKNRGVIFNAENKDGTININYIPDLEIKKLNLTLKNKDLQKDATLYYLLNYGGAYQKNNSLLLSWYPKNKNALDFTGQNILNRYPIMASAASAKEITNPDYTQKLGYKGFEMIKATQFDLTSFIYTKNNAVSLDLKSDNLDVKVGVENASMDISAINQIFDLIKQKELCVTGNIKNISVFINEAGFID